MESNEHNPTPPSAEPIKITPLGEIALALSGGGFRAATYSLGCLAYLERVIYQKHSLLRNVKFISSASGGSITALFYASEIAKGNSFQNIFLSLYTFLENSHCIAKAFKTLRSQEPWIERKGKGRNLINAFAITYDQQLFKGALLGDIMNTTNSHLDEVCINSTEFNYGITFRFQTGSGRVGNSEININYNTSLSFKLGDILAASSCFPMGFEPIMMPQDFSHSKLSTETIRNATTGKNTVGLMDGGITDNQGIHSFLLAEERKKNKNTKGYDLFMYCDVASPYMEKYELPTEKKSFLGTVSVQSYINIFKLAPLLLGACIYFLISFTQSWWMIVLTTLSTLFTGTYLASLILYLGQRKKAWHDQGTWLITLYKYINEILFTRSSAIAQMISARIKSGGILIGDVYLKQIRRLTIKSLYENLEGGQKWRRHAIGNFLYELGSINTERSSSSFAGLKDLKGNPIVVTPSKEMVVTADKAREMDTTLWFDEFHVADNRRESIVAAGEFTTCYNLLEYVCRLEKAGPMSAELKVLQQKLINDWNRFNIDPNFIATPKAYLDPGNAWDQV